MKNDLDQATYIVLLKEDALFPLTVFLPRVLLAEDLFHIPYWLMFVYHNNLTTKAKQKW